MRILIASSVHRRAIDRLSRSHEVTCAFGPPANELRTLVRDQDVLVFRSGVTISKEVLNAAPGLKLIVRAGSGLDNIDLAEIERRGITLVRIPRPSARAVAELTFGLMLSLARNLLQMDALWRQGQWVKHTFENYLLHDKVLGVVGAGNIGSCVGRLGAAWGMRVLGCVEHADPTTAPRLRRLGIELASFDEVVAQADFLTIHVPLGPDTRGLIDASVLTRMKPGSYLVNTARGGVVDETALYHALRSGERLRGAALDVHENEGAGKLSPLRHLPNVVLTPHVGASTVDTQEEIGREIVEIVESFQTEREAQVAATG